MWQRRRNDGEVSQRPVADDTSTKSLSRAVSRSVAMTTASTAPLPFFFFFFPTNFAMMINPQKNELNQRQRCIIDYYRLLLGNSLVFSAILRRGQFSQSAEWRIAVKLATLLQLGPSVSIEIVCNFAEIDKLRRDAILFPIPLGKLKIGDLFLAFLGKKRKKCKRLCNKFDRIWRRQGEMQKCKMRRWQIAKLTSAKVLFALVFCFPTKLIERKNETIRNCFHYRHYRNI